MGRSVDATLVWGIPVSAYDEHGEPTQFWNEAEDDWIDFEEIEAKRSGVSNPWDDLPDEVNNGTSGEYEAWKRENPEWVARLEAWYEAKKLADPGLRFEYYGHCDDPDGPRAILTSTRIETIDGDAWTPKRVPVDELHTEATWDKLYSKAEDAARYFDLGVSFYGDAGWYLVASYG